ncbi:hypothetical protein SUGI_0208490 [Cryptomeria japonica]|nr:hypothetical protein SUGI_0208490 [Cryptomeria japonica]
MGEKAKNTKGRSKKKDLPPLPTSNSRDSSPRYYDFQKKAVHPLPSSEESSRNGNNRGPLDVFHKYIKMIKPLYEKISNKCDQRIFSGHLRVDKNVSASEVEKRIEAGSESRGKKKYSLRSSHHVCFTEDPRKVKKNFGFGSPRGTSPSHGCMVTGRSYPSSMVSSPSHSGVLIGRSYPSSMVSSPTHSGVLNGLNSSTISSMEELQSAVQAAIAHCKNSNSISSDLQVSERF